MGRLSHATWIIHRCILKHFLYKAYEQFNIFALMRMLKELQKHQVQRNLQVKLNCTLLSFCTDSHKAHWVEQQDQRRDDKNQDPLTPAPLSSQPSSLSCTDPFSVFAAATHDVVWAPQVRKHGTTTTKRDETGPELKVWGSRTGKRRK